MKKLFSIVLALVLLMGIACAEAPASTRMRMLQLDADFQEVFETFYTAEGYSLWYQADLLESGMFYDNVMFKPVGAAEEDESVSYVIVPVEITAEESEAMIAEATGGYEPEWTISDVRELTSDVGGKILSVEANNGAEIHRYYLVQGEAFSLCITAIYPAEDAMEMSACFDVMTMTIELEAAEAEL